MKEKIINKKSITIYTIIIILLSIITFEIGYCNTQLIKNIINGEINNTYNFSFCRIVIYIVILTLYLIFKNQFIEEAIETSKNKYKRIFIYLTIIAVVLSIIATVIVCKIYTDFIRVMVIGLITAFLASLFIIYVSNNQIKNVILISCTLGIVFTFTTRYNHAIDEKKHFMTALNLSFLNFDYVENPITDKGIEKLPQLTKYIKIDNFFGKYNEDITTDVNKEDVPSTPAGYNFITYIFPTIGIWVARILGGSIIDMYILGRIMNLILYTILICFAIKIIPYKKNILFAVAMMPFMLLLAASYSIDGYCIGTVFIFIAYCLKIYKENDTIKLKQFFTLLIIFIFMLLAKNMAYICTAGIIFMLPLWNTIKKNKKYIPIIIVITIITIILICMALIYVKNSSLGDGVGDTRAAGETNVTKQLKLLLKNPIHDIKLIIEHTKNTLLNFNWYANLYPGAFFTKYAPSVVLPYIIYILYISLIEDEFILKIKDKIIFIISFLLVWGMTSAALYLSYTQVGALYIDGYQTRYIVPVLPLLLLCIANNKVISKKNVNRNMNISIISTIFILIGIAQLIVT